MSRTARLLAVNVSVIGALLSGSLSSYDLGKLERNPTRTKEKFVLAGLLFSFQWDSFYWDFVLVGFRSGFTLYSN